MRKLKYYPFGKEATPSDQWNVALQFTGHERDRNDLATATDDGDYLHARFLGAAAGRLLSIDPIPGHPGRPQSWNQYSYVQGNPLNYTDPTGLVLKAMTEEAKSDMCALVGVDCNKFLSFGDDGTVTVTATSDELASNEALNLFNDLASSANVYGALVGSSLPIEGGSLTLGGGRGERIAYNVSRTPDDRPGAESKLQPPAGFGGVTGIFSGIEGAAKGADGRPAHRPSALFHELAENYLRTEKMQQYRESHAGAIGREQILRTQRPELNHFLLGAGTYSRQFTN